jgi:Domain of unknown function (DUF4190)
MSDTPEDQGASEPTPSEAHSAGHPTGSAPAAPPMPGAPAMMPASTPSNGFAVASLVLGIVSLVLFFTIWLPFLLGTLAIVFGALGISKANKPGGRQKGLAIAGLVCGVVGIVIAVLFIVAIVNVVNDPSVQVVINSLVPSPPA